MSRHCWHRYDSRDQGTYALAIFRMGHWIEIRCCHCGKITEVTGEEIIPPGHGRFSADKTVNYTYPTDECEKAP